MLHPTDFERIREIVNAIAAAILVTLIGRTAVAIWTFAS
jgi:hypothetical protein